RARRTARAHLPDEAGAGGGAGDRERTAAPGPLPDLPRLRDDLSVGRRVRQAPRYRPRGHRGTHQAPGGRARPPLAPGANLVGSPPRRGGVRPRARGAAAASRIARRQGATPPAAAALAPG